MEPQTQTNHPQDRPVLPFAGWGILNGIRNLFHSSSGIPRAYTVERPDITLNDVAGEDDARAALREIVDFLHSVGKYHPTGGPAPRAILLVGQPGTGKTLLARAAAGQAGVPFYHLDAQVLVEKFAGSAARQVHELFRSAKASAPAVVFIDHLDALASQPAAMIGNTQALHQLLVEMSAVGERQGVAVIAATSRPEMLDPMLLQPGRFDRPVSATLPDRKGREGILAIHTRRLRLATNANLGMIARTTTGLTGAGLASLCSEASRIAARKAHELIDMADFEEALDCILLGAPRRLLLSDSDRRAAAYHEAGHALAAWLSPTLEPIHRVSIFPHMRVPDASEQHDGSCYSKSYLLDWLNVILGGRAGEELATGDVTTRAENDLFEATRLARRMVTRWGMGSLGPIAFEQTEVSSLHSLKTNPHRERGQAFGEAFGGACSQATAARIDQEVQDLLKDRYAAVTHLLENAREALDRLVEALLENETIDQGEMAALLGPRPYDPELDAGLPVQVSQINQP